MERGGKKKERNKTGKERKRRVKEKRDRTEGCRREKMEEDFRAVVKEE